MTAAALCALGAGVASAQTASDFTDWTSVSTSASGTLNGAGVTLTGTGIQPAGSKTDGTSTVFNRSDFTPALPTADVVGFNAASGNSYQLQFGGPTTNPVLDVGSLGSTLHFPGGTSITRVSGDAQLTVSGSDVVGAIETPTDDANGTVRLVGSFTSIGFTTTSIASTDGAYLQVGAPRAGGQPTATPPATGQPVTCQEFARNQPTDASLDICAYRVAAAVSAGSVKLFADLDTLRMKLADMLPSFDDTADRLNDTHAERKKLAKQLHLLADITEGVARRTRLPNGASIGAALLQIAGKLKVRGVGLCYRHCG
jgi:hypothetical protein